MGCADGGTSDHDGYMPSPPPPVYGSDNNTPAPPTKPYKTTKAPYKTTKPPKPYNGGNKTPAPSPYGEVTENNGYVAYPGPMKNKAYCPWNKNTYSGGTYSGDCKSGKCNLKYVGRCLNNLFNKVYKDICLWKEASSLQKEINAFLIELGVKIEAKWNMKCNKNLPENNGGTRTFDLDPMFDYDLSQNDKTILLESDYDYDYDYDRRRRADVREVPGCNIGAGNIDCSLIDFHNVKNELDYYNKIEKLIGEVGKKCNNEWNNRMNSFLVRFKNSMTCPGGFPDHK